MCLRRAHWIDWNAPQSRTIVIKSYPKGYYKHEQHEHSNVFLSFFSLLFKSELSLHLVSHLFVLRTSFRKLFKWVFLKLEGVAMFFRTLLAVLLLFFFFLLTILLRISFGFIFLALVKGIVVASVRIFIFLVVLFFELLPLLSRFLLKLELSWFPFLKIIVLPSKFITVARVKWVRLVKKRCGLPKVEILFRHVQKGLFLIINISFGGITQCVICLWYFVKDFFGIYRLTKKKHMKLNFYQDDTWGPFAWMIA